MSITTTIKTDDRFTIRVLTSREIAIEDVTFDCSDLLAELTIPTFLADLTTSEHEDLASAILSELPKSSLRDVLRNLDEDLLLEVAGEDAAMAYFDLKKEE